MSPRLLCGVVLASAALAVSLSATPQPQREAAEDLLGRARQALGGEARLASIRSFVVSGSLERGYRSRSNYGSFEVACELPDRYVSRESLTSLSPSAPGRPSEWRETSRLGFNGARVIYEPSGTLSTRRMAPPAFGQDDVARLLPQAQRDFVRLTLGMFAGSFAGAPITFSDGSRPQSVIARVNGQGLTLEFDPTTHLPARLESLQYSDYRLVDGVKVPFSLADDSSTSIRSWTIHTVRFNVDISDKTFRMK